MKNGKIACLAGFSLALFMAIPSLMPLRAEGKRLEVTAEKADVYVDPSSRSALVTSLSRGAILTLASPAKMKVNWYYIYFISPESGRTRAGYIHDSQVRPLYPQVRVINISSGTPDSNSTVLDPGSGDPFDPSWGTTRESIVRTEGNPSDDESKDGIEVLRYRRKIMNRNWQVEYVLGDGGLITTRYKLLEDYSDSARYLEDYNTLRVYLNTKVGEPRSDKVVWRNKVFEQARATPAEALSRGYVAYSSEWVFRDTSVKIKLDGAGNMVALNAEIQDVKSGYSVE